MHIASRLTRSLHEDRAARALLDDRHPLVRAVYRTSVALERSCVVCGMACASAAGHLEGVHGALAYLVASVVVQGALACDLALLASRRVHCARDLIIHGRTDLPLHTVQRERGRLLDPARRAVFADQLDAIRQAAQRPVPRLRAARPMFNLRVVTAVDPELAVVARRLRSETPGVRGIAMAQRLLSDGCSPLYGASTGALREELRRIIFMLGG
jgi:hypothetical protein